MMMRRYLLVAVVALTVNLQSALAEEAVDGTPAGQEQAGEARIPADLALELIEALEVGGMLREAARRSEEVVKRSVAEDLSGQGKLTSEQMEIYEGMEREMAEIFAGAVAWEEIRPKVVAAVRRSFTREEAEGIVAFFDTPGGRAMSSKVPAVLGHAMEQLDVALMREMPRLKEIERDARERVAAAGGEGEAE